MPAIFMKVHTGNQITIPGLISDFSFRVPVSGSSRSCTGSGLLPRQHCTALSSVACLGRPFIRRLYSCALDQTRFISQVSRSRFPMGSVNFVTHFSSGARGTDESKPKDSSRTPDQPLAQTFVLFATGYSFVWAKRQLSWLQCLG